MDGDDDDAQEFDPEIDLLQRYETMVQTQVETLNGIDDKAAYVSRLIGILVGLVLTSVSIVVSADGFRFNIDSVGAFLLIFFGSLGLFSALVYSIITYLSSKFMYGPSSDLGETMAQYAISDQDYKDVMLRGYSAAIRDNRRVIVTNAQRFERCLSSLVVGLLFLLGGAVLIVLPNHALVDGVVVVGFTLSAALIGRHILREEYLTLERKHPDDD